MKVPNSKQSQEEMVAKLDRRIKKLCAHLEDNSSHFHDFHARKALERFVQKRAQVIQAMESEN